LHRFDSGRTHDAIVTIAGCDAATDGKGGASMDPFDQKLLAKLRKDPWSPAGVQMHNFEPPTLRDYQTGREYKNPKYKPTVKPQHVLRVSKQKIAAKSGHPGKGGADTLIHHWKKFQSMPAGKRFHAVTEEMIRFLEWLAEQAGKIMNAVGEGAAILIEGLGGFVISVTSDLLQKLQSLRTAAMRAATTALEKTAEIVATLVVIGTICLGIVAILM
jgi:hypothetical protein